MQGTCLGLALLLVAGPREGETIVVPLTAQRRLEFLGVSEGRRAIVESDSDPFFRTIGPLDIELRLAEPTGGVPRARQLQQLKKQFADAVRPWSPEEVQALTEACRALDRRASRLVPRFLPARWRFLKTDGSEEAGAAYTRHDVIILPDSRTRAGIGAHAALRRLLAHETAHVVSRQNPDLAQRLYARLGFRRVGPIDLGEYLSRRRLTNPDGPVIEHVIRVETPATGPFDAALVTYSKTERFASEHGRRLFDYLEFGLFAVEERNGAWRVRVPADGRPSAYSPAQVTRFYEQIGRNTRYVIHPEEILAENLAVLLTADDGARSPPDAALLRDVARIVNEHRFGSLGHTKRGPRAD